MTKSKYALLICDMLNQFDFPEADQLIHDAEKAAKAILHLKRALKKKKVPIIYVNDNFDDWLADWKRIWNSCVADTCKGRKIARLLKPEDDDFFILKPKHSGFHSTPLEILLKKIGVDKLIITGIAGNICVLFTAHDAHMREFEVIVPSDCTASNTKASNNFALSQLRENFGMHTPKSISLVKSFGKHSP